MNASGGQSGSSDAGTDAPLETIIDDATSASDGQKTSVGDLLEAFGTQSLGPITLLGGLLTIIPVIGMLPLVPFIIGLVVALFAGQYIVGKKRIWVPSKIRELSLQNEKLDKAQEKSQPWLKRLDRLFTERMTFMSNGVMDRLTAVVVLLLGLSMFPLGLVPGGVAAPGWALILFGVGLTARDGLFLLLAYVATAIVAYVLVSQIF